MSSLRLALKKSLQEAAAAASTTKRTTSTTTNGAPQQPTPAGQEAVVFPAEQQRTTGGSGATVPQHQSSAITTAESNRSSCNSTGTTITGTNTNPAAHTTATAIATTATDVTVSPAVMNYTGSSFPTTTTSTHANKNDGGSSSEENEASLNDLDDDDDDTDTDTDDESSMDHKIGSTSKGQQQNRIRKDDSRTNSTNNNRNTTTTTTAAAANTIQKQYRIRQLNNSKDEKEPKQQQHPPPNVKTTTTTKSNHNRNKKAESSAKKKKTNRSTTPSSSRDRMENDNDEMDIDDNNDNDDDSHSSSDTSTTVLYTVVPPTMAMIRHMASIATVTCCQQIIAGLRVKVLFDNDDDDSDDSDDGENETPKRRSKKKMEQTKKWYGGYIRKVYTTTTSDDPNNNTATNNYDSSTVAAAAAAIGGGGGAVDTTMTMTGCIPSPSEPQLPQRKIKIAYDDGTTEVTNFPDRKKHPTTGSNNSNNNNTSSTSVHMNDTDAATTTAAADDTSHWYYTDTIIIDDTHNGHHMTNTAIQMALDIYTPILLSTAAVPPPPPAAAALEEQPPPPITTTSATAPASLEEQPSPPPIKTTIMMMKSATTTTNNDDKTNIITTTTTVADGMNDGAVDASPNIKGEHEAAATISNDDRIKHHHDDDTTPVNQQPTNNDNVHMEQQQVLPGEKQQENLTVDTVDDLYDDDADVLLHSSSSSSKQQQTPMPLEDVTMTTSDDSPPQKIGEYNNNDNDELVVDGDESIKDKNHSKGNVGSRIENTAIATTNCSIQEDQPPLLQHQQQSSKELEDTTAAAHQSHDNSNDDDERLLSLVVEQQLPILRTVPTAEDPVLRPVATAEYSIVPSTTTIATKILNSAASIKMVTVNATYASTGSRGITNDSSTDIKNCNATVAGPESTTTTAMESTNDENTKNNDDVMHCEDETIVQDQELVAEVGPENRHETDQIDADHFTAVVDNVQVQQKQPLESKSDTNNVSIVFLEIMATNDTIQLEKDDETKEKNQIEFQEQSAAVEQQKERQSTSESKMSYSDFAQHVQKEQPLPKQHESIVTTCESNIGNNRDKIETVVDTTINIRASSTESIDVTASTTSTALPVNDSIEELSQEKITVVSTAERNNDDTAIVDEFVVDKQDDDKTDMLPDLLPAIGGDAEIITATTQLPFDVQQPVNDTVVVADDVPNVDRMDVEVATTTTDEAMEAIDTTTTAITSMIPVLASSETTTEEVDESMGDIDVSVATVPVSTNSNGDNNLVVPLVSDGKTFIVKTDCDDTSADIGIREEKVDYDKMDIYPIDSSAEEQMKDTTTNPIEFNEEHRCTISSITQIPINSKANADASTAIDVVSVLSNTGDDVKYPANLPQLLLSSATKVDDKQTRTTVESRGIVDSSSSSNKAKRPSSETDPSEIVEPPKKKLTIRIPLHKLKQHLSSSDGASMSTPKRSIANHDIDIKEVEEGQVEQLSLSHPAADANDAVEASNLSPRQLKKLIKLERKRQKMMAQHGDEQETSEIVASDKTTSIVEISKSVDGTLSDGPVYTPTSDVNDINNYQFDGGGVGLERQAALEANDRIVSKIGAAVDSDLPSATVPDEAPKKKKKGVRRKTMEGDNDLKSSKENEIELDDSQWVQCDKCGKWRIIPTSVVEELPKQWYCSDNKYDPKHSSCDAPEQTDKEVAREKKRRLKKKQRKAAEEAAAAAEGSLSQRPEIQSSESTIRIEDVVDRSPRPPRDTLVDSERASKQPKCIPIVEKSQLPELPLTTTESRPPKKEKKISVSTVKRGRSVESMDKLVPPSEDPVSAVAVTDVVKPRGRGRPRRTNTTSTVTNNTIATKESIPIGGGSSSVPTPATEDGENLEWVQCEKCDKWRKLPPQVSADDLPDVWTCDMNTWNPTSASCDAPEDKSEGLQDIGVFGSNGSAAGKLTYRHLIFGSNGRKANRPISEKTCAAESIFSAHFDEDVVPTKVLYADSSAYISRGRPNISIDDNEGMSVLELMSHSKLWQELHGMSSPSQQSLGHSPNTSLLNNETARMNSYVYDTLPTHIQEQMKEYVLQVLDTDTLSGDEVIQRIQRQLSVNGTTPLDTTIQPYCTATVIVTTLCDLVKIGTIECIQKIGTSIATDCWNPHYRRTLQRVTPINHENDHQQHHHKIGLSVSNENEQQQQRRLSFPMKLSKPWKHAKL